MKIKKLKGTFEIDVKRFYPPFSITDNCPNCGEEVVGCDKSQYLSYPKLNTPTRVSFCCCTCEEDEDLPKGAKFEWEKKVIITMDVREA